MTKKILFFVLFLNLHFIFAQSSDTTEVNTVDAIATEDSTDSSDSDDEVLPWTFSFHNEYSKTKINKGVEVSNDLPTYAAFFSLGHSTGLSANIMWMRSLGDSSGFLYWSGAVGYEYSYKDNFTASASYSHTQYSSDSSSAIAALENNFTLSARYAFSFVNIGVSYEQYLGTYGAHFFSFDMNHEFEIGNLAITPSASIAFLSQTIEITRLNALKQQRMQNKKQVPNAKTKTVDISGISSMQFGCEALYDLGKGFSLYATPEYVLTPKIETAKQARQFIFSIGAQYRAEF